MSKNKGVLSAVLTGATVAIITAAVVVLISGHFAASDLPGVAGAGLAAAALAWWTRRRTS